MKKIIFFVCLVTFSIANAQEYKEIHCKHFYKGIPLFTDLQTNISRNHNDLIIRDAYALSSNDSTKFADWVCYLLDSNAIRQNKGKERKWDAEPWLDEKETLEPNDYKGASEKLLVDRGHQAPLASLQGRDDWYTTNYLSNITPQNKDLNQVLWRILEEKTRDLVQKFGTVYVYTGTLYEKEMGTLPNADESHKIPSGYWMIAVFEANKKPNSVAFICNQDTKKDDKIISKVVNIDEIEKRAKLNLFWEMDENLEKQFESKIDKEFIKENYPDK